MLLNVCLSRFGDQTCGDATRRARVRLACVLCVTSLTCATAPAQNDSPMPADPATTASAQPSGSTGQPIYAAGWADDAVPIEKELRSLSSKYLGARKAEKPGNAEKAILTKWIELNFTKFTIPSEYPAIPEIRTKLLNEIQTSVTSKASREFMLAEIVRLAPKLFDQPPVVRLNAVILLANLNREVPNNAPPIPYLPAHQPLVDIVTDPNQLIECKVWAVKGLGRICSDGDPDVNLRIKAATTLLDALNSPLSKQPANVWYRYRNVEAMGFTGRAFNLVNQPAYIDALMSVLNDPAEHPLVRSMAAISVTQLPWDANTNVPLIAHEVGRLTHQIAEAQIAEAQRKDPPRPYWKNALLNVYLCFYPQSPAVAAQRKWGIYEQLKRPGLNKDKAAVDGTYRAILPVVNAVISNPKPVPAPAAAVQNLGNWLQNSAPNNRKVTPGSKELIDRSKPPASDPPTTPAQTTPAATGQVIGRTAGP